MLGVACGLLLLSGSLAAAESGAYGFLRQVEGSADLVTLASQGSIEATANYPLQVGDRLVVAQDGRLEAVLPDGSQMRLGNNTELRLGRLAGEPDHGDTVNLLHLVQGRVQVEVPVAESGTTEFRIDAANATVLLLEPGSYRIFTDGRSWTEVLVRTGLAEVITQGESIRLDDGRQVLIEGARSPRAMIEAAAPADELEIWADQLTREAETPYRRGHVAPPLRYAAAPLYRYGSWVDIGGLDVWRPRVQRHWRPYHSGWWIYTTIGLTWVSTEPWGWVTYHYGAWDFAPGFGWVWYPGRSFSPGRVVWYWGPDYVGWAPAGPYSPYMHSPYYAFPPYGHFTGWQRYGTSAHRAFRNRWTGFPLESATGSPALRRWSFCRYDQFGYRDSYRHLIDGSELASLGLLQDGFATGIFTTDTRDLTPGLWGSPEQVLARLRRPHPSQVSKRRGLSPLGTAAIGSGPTGGSDPIRRWDSSDWRRRNSSRPVLTDPLRRDSRFSRTVPSRRSPGSRGPLTMGGRSRSYLPGTDRPGLPRLLGPRRHRPGSLGSSRVTPGRPTQPSRSGSAGGFTGSAGRPGRSSGVSRQSRSSGGPG